MGDEGGAGKCLSGPPLRDAARRIVCLGEMLRDGKLKIARFDAATASLTRAPRLSPPWPSQHSGTPGGTPALHEMPEIWR